MEEIALKIKSLDAPARQMLLNFLDVLLLKPQPGSGDDPPKHETDIVNDAEGAVYETSRISRFHLLDKTSQALVLNFIETLLKKQWKKQSPDDPFGNKAWKKKLREEVSVWSEEDVRKWEENLRKLSNWEAQTW